MGKLMEMFIAEQKKSSEQTEDSIKQKKLTERIIEKRKKDIRLDPEETIEAERQRKEDDEERNNSYPH